MEKETHLIEISVGLRLDKKEMVDFLARNACVVDILLKNSERVVFTKEEKAKYTEIEYVASIPENIVNGHHNFDSRLNKSWPEGAGAAWVEDFNERKTKTASHQE